MGRGGGAGAVRRGGGDRARPASHTQPPHRTPSRLTAPAARARTPGGTLRRRPSRGPRSRAGPSGATRWPRETRLSVSNGPRIREEADDLALVLGARRRAEGGEAARDEGRCRRGRRGVGGGVGVGGVGDEHEVQAVAWRRGVEGRRRPLPRPAAARRHRGHPPHPAPAPGRYTWRSTNAAARSASSLSSTGRRRTRPGDMMGWSGAAGAGQWGARELPERAGSGVALRAHSPRPPAHHARHQARRRAAEERSAPEIGAPGTGRCANAGGWRGGARAGTPSRAPNRARRVGRCLL